MLARKWAEGDYAYQVPQTQPIERTQPQPRRQATITAHPSTTKRLLQQAKRNRALRQKALALVLAVTAMAGLITLENSVIAAKGFEIVQLRTEAAKLEGENTQLRITNAQLKSPQRIKDIAEQKLGMSVSDQVYFAEGK